MINFYINKCLSFENTYLDYPFDQGLWAAIRHKDNKKIFALIYERQGNICINFKNDPQWGMLWRESFEAVTPAYHMNKEHWSTVIIGKDATEENITDMLYASYLLTQKKPRKSK